MISNFKILTVGFVISAFSGFLLGCASTNGVLVDGLEDEPEPHVSELVAKSVLDILQEYGEPSNCVVLTCQPEAMRAAAALSMNRCLEEREDLSVKNGLYVSASTGKPVVVVIASLREISDSEVIIEVFAAIGPMAGNSYIYRYKQKEGVWKLVSRKLSMLS